MAIIFKIVELFIIIFLAYFLMKKNILNKDSIKSFSNLMFFVTIPCLIIYALCSGETPKNVSLSMAFLASILMFIFSIIFGYLLIWILRIKDGYKGIYRFMTIFGNVAFIGFPVTITILGKEYLFYAAIYNIIFNVLAFSLGVYLMSSDKNKATFNLKKLINPPLISTCIGLLFFLSGIHLPAFFINLTNTLGSITTPLSLIVVGGSLYGINFKEAIKNKYIWIISLAKLVIIPILLSLVFALFKINYDVAAVGIIVAGMPVASISVILAQEYNGDVKIASEGVFISTMLMLINVPLLKLLTDFYKTLI